MEISQGQLCSAASKRTCKVNEHPQRLRRAEGLHSWRGLYILSSEVVMVKKVPSDPGADEGCSFSCLKCLLKFISIQIAKLQLSSSNKHTLYIFNRQETCAEFMSFWSEGLFSNERPHLSLYGNIHPPFCPLLHSLLPQFWDLWWAAWMLVIMIIHMEQNAVSSSSLAHYEGEAPRRAGWEWTGLQCVLLFACLAVFPWFLQALGIFPSEISLYSRTWWLSVGTLWLLHS